MGIPVPFQSSRIAVAEHNLGGCFVGAVQRIHQCLWLDDGMIGDVNVAALILHAGPAAAGHGKLQGEGLAVKGDEVRLDGMSGQVLRLDQEQICQFLSFVGGEHQIIGHRIRNGHNDGVGIVLKLACTDKDLPQDLLLAIAVGGVGIIGAVRVPGSGRAAGMVSIGLGSVGIIVVTIEGLFLALGGKTAGVLAVDILLQSETVGGIGQTAVVLQFIILAIGLTLVSEVAVNVDGQEGVGLVGFQHLCHSLHIKDHRKAMLAVFAKVIAFKLSNDGIVRSFLQGDFGLGFVVAGQFNNKRPFFVVFNGYFTDALISGHHIHNGQFTEISKRNLFLLVVSGNLPFGQQVVDLDHVCLLDKQTAGTGKGGFRFAGHRSAFEAFAEGTLVINDIAVLEAICYIAGSILSLDRLCEIHQLIQLDAALVSIGAEGFVVEGKAVQRLGKGDIGGISSAGQGRKTLLIGVPVGEAVDLKGIGTVHQQFHVCHGIHEGNGVVEIPAKIHIPPDNGLAVIQNNFAVAVYLVAAILDGFVILRNGLLIFFALGRRLAVHRGQVSGVRIGLRVHITQRFFHRAGHIGRQAQVVSARLQHCSGGSSDRHHIGAILNLIHNGNAAGGRAQGCRVDIVAPVGFRNVHAFEHSRDLVRRAEAHGIVDLICYGKGLDGLANIDHHAEVHIVLLCVLIIINAGIIRPFFQEHVFVNLKLIFGHLVPSDLCGSSQCFFQGRTVFLQLNSIGLLGVGIAAQLIQSSILFHLHPIDDGVGALIEDIVRTGNGHGIHDAAVGNRN